MRRCASNLFLPAPVTSALAVIRSAKYIKEGLLALWHRKLSVAVLDATAVTVSMVRGDLSNQTICYTWIKGVFCDTTIYYRTRNIEFTEMPTSSWESYYLVIASANVVLHFIDRLSIPEHRKDYYKGSAYFYKALAYLDLVRLWGDCVLVEEDVPLETRAKSYWTEIADHAIDLARKAVALLPDFDKVLDSNGNAVRFKSAPCKGAANAVLANLCAWKAGGKYFAQPSQRNYDENKLWEEAEKACTAIIGSETGVPGGIYRLANTPEDVCTKVLAGGDAESIYESVFVNFWDELGNFTSTNDFWAIALQAYPMPEATFDDIKSRYIQIYNETVRKLYPEGDLRRDAYFYKFDEMEQRGDSATGGFAYPYKYRKVAVKTSGDEVGRFDHIDQNRIWWRLADIYLLRAECRVHLQKNDLAIADLNIIRLRAKAKLYNADEYDGDLRMAIFKEREKELLFEGTRYFDIIRNQYVKTMLGTGYRQATDQDYVDGILFWAINETAFRRNPKLRQNTYWQKYK